MARFFGAIARHDLDLDDGLDLVQARYGWTDDEVEALRPARLIAAVDMCQRRQDEAERQQMQLAAFIGWQVAQPVEKVGDGHRRIGLDEYLKRLGLFD